MSRDAFSHDRQDTRDLYPRRAGRQRTSTPPDTRDSRHPAPEHAQSFGNTDVRGDRSIRDDRSESRRACYLRDRAFLLRDSEMHSLTEVGKFRVIADFCKGVHLGVEIGRAHV